VSSDSFADVLEDSTDDGTKEQTEKCFSHGDVIEGDVLHVAEELPENSFHAVVCDPPYNFEDGFMQEDWDDVGSPSEYQQWCQQWAESLLDPLKPGGHLIAFSGNRSHHRLFSGIEDAGYEIRDTITWHYANGFPKAPRIERWLDDEYKEQFGDWRGMLKPASEFAVLARAPLEGTSSTKNQIRHGVGNLNVEACRLPLVDDSEVWEGDDGFNEVDGKSLEGSKNGELNTQNSGLGEEGRFPPNLALDPVMADVMDLLAGDVAGGDNREECDGQRDGGFYDVGSENGQCEPNSRVYADDGGASRFFYCSKASSSERNVDGAVDNDHPTVKPLDLMGWLVKMVTAEDQWVLDPFAGSGTTLIAADDVSRNAVGIEMDAEYASLARERFVEATS